MDAKRGNRSEYKKSSVSATSSPAAVVASSGGSEVDAMVKDAASQSLLPSSRCRRRSLELPVAQKEDGARSCSRQEATARSS